MPHQAASLRHHIARNQSHDRLGEGLPEGDADSAVTPQTNGARPTGAVISQVPWKVQSECPGPEDVPLRPLQTFRQLKQNPFLRVPSRRWRESRLDWLDSLSTRDHKRLQEPGERQRPSPQRPDQEPPDCQRHRCSARQRGRQRRRFPLAKHLFA